MIPYLDQFIEGQARGWSFASVDQAKRWAYKIRESFSIAKTNEKEYPAYALLANAYIVKHIGLSVELVPTGSLPVTTAKPTGVVEADTKTVIANPVADIAIVWDADKIAAFCSTKNDTDRVHFPNANLSDEELVKLYQWCNTFSPPRLMFVAIGDVTVRHYSAEFEDVAWSPDDLR